MHRADRRLLRVDGDQRREGEATLRHRDAGSVAVRSRGLWENWKNPATGEWVRTFCIITTAANDLVGRIHDRMPAILRPEDYDQWLRPEPEATRLLTPFPAEQMTIWPISTRVNSPKNDDAQLLEPLAEADPYWPPDGNSA